MVTFGARCPHRDSVSRALSLCQCFGRATIEAEVTGLVGLRASTARRMRALPVLRRYPATYVAAGLHGFRMRADFDAVRADVKATVVP